MEKGIKILEKIMVAVVGAIGLFMALYLSYYSMRYSYSMKLEYTQEVFEYADSLLLHLISIVIFIAIVVIVALVMKKSTMNMTNRKVSIPMLVVMTVMFVGTLAWIFGIKNVPANDQKWLLDTIIELINGNYEVFLPHGFLGAVQHQIGLATFFLWIFKIFNSFDYHIIQVINALCILLLIYFGKKCSSVLFKDKYTEIVYLLLMCLCIPLYVYSAFVYGEMISITAGMGMIWFILWYLQSKKFVAIIPICVCAIIGTMTRGNYLVLTIACAMLLMWEAISKANWKCVILAICMVACPLIQKEVALNVYEAKAGFELEEGMSKNLWIAMGMQENEDVANGWYNGYIYKVYNGVGQNSVEASKQADAYIKDRTTMFRNGAANWREFYKEKILSQWNEPTYECFSATANFEDGSRLLVDNIYTGTIHKNIESFTNQYQLIIYIGFVLYILACLIRKAPFVNYLLVIYIIGGILFSALWEASSRYVFPYFVFMIPCAAYGWTSLCTMLLEKKDIIIRKFKRAN